MTEDIVERIRAFGLALVIIGVMGAIAIPFMIFIGGPTSDSAGYHEGRVFAFTETSGYLFFIALGMVATGAILYVLTRRRTAPTAD